MFLTFAQIHLTNPYKSMHLAKLQPIDFPEMFGDFPFGGPKTRLRSRAHLTINSIPHPYPPHEFRLGTFLLGFAFFFTSILAMVRRGSEALTVAF